MQLPVSFLRIIAEAQQQLHLLLSSSNQKSIDDAKRLAENLMDTISVEFGASRFILFSRVSSKCCHR